MSLAPAAAPLVLSLNGSALYLGSAAGALVGRLVLQFAGPNELGIAGALFPLAGLGIMRWMQRTPRPLRVALG